MVTIIWHFMLSSDSVMTTISIRRTSCPATMWEGFEEPTNADESALDKSCSFSGWDSDAGVEFDDPFGSVAIILSWLTNILATILISHKAWYAETFTDK